MANPLRRLMSVFSPRGTVPGQPPPPSWVKAFAGHVIELGGDARFELSYEEGTDDPIVQGYLRNDRPNEYLTEMLLRFTRPGDCVLDLGAHVGTFALTAAALGRRVIAVDASPKHAALLNRSVERNGFERMTVVHTAIGERRGTVRFHVAGLWGMIAQEGHEIPEVRNQPIVEVPIIRGDRLLKQLGQGRVDFLKMDIEGSEIAAVRGLGSLLRRDDAPILYYECNALTLGEFGHTTAELRATLESYGYRSYRAEGGRFRQFPAADFQPELYIDLVAMKPRHEAVVGATTIDQAPGFDELVEMSVAESRQAHHAHRSNLARVLASAPRALRDDGRIQRVLDRLANDPSEQVRKAATWWLRREAGAA